MGVLIKDWRMLVREHAGEIPLPIGNSDFTQ